MLHRISHPAGWAGLVVAGALAASFTGYANDAPRDRTDRQQGVERRAQAALVVEDDYDYYPGYEMYYNRSRQEYVYREGAEWIRRPTPLGVAVETLNASPSVHLDFHDAPERHHDDVVKTYPKHWAPPAKPHDDTGDGKNRSGAASAPGGTGSGSATGNDARR